MLVRNVQFEFGDDIPRFWNAGNAFLTHSFNGINLVFPAVERFFIRCALACRSCDMSDDLRKSVQVFTQQEGRHSRAHEAYFDWLRRMGYPIDRFLRFFEAYVRWRERSNGTRFNLACAAVGEHYTSLFAGAMLQEPSLLEGCHPEMRRFIVWHAAEEIEHHEVLHDLMKVAGVGRFTRAAGFIVLSMEIVIWSTLGSLIFMRHDRLSLWRIFKMKRAFLKKVPHLSRSLRDGAWAYLRSSDQAFQAVPLGLAHKALAESGFAVPEDTASK